MPPLSQAVQEIEKVAGDLIESIPTLGQVVHKIDPHLAAVNEIIELAPRLENVVTQLEQIAGTLLQEPPAPTASKSQAQPDTEAESSTVQEPVTIEVTREQAAALGKTPIQITAPHNN